MVGDGPEATLGGSVTPRWTVDIGADTIHFQTRRLSQTTANSGFLVLDGLDWQDAMGMVIGGVQLVREGIIGLDAEDVSFTRDRITVDVRDVFWIQELSYFELTIEKTAAPEPALPGLLALAAAGLCAAHGRRRADGRTPTQGA